MSALTHEAAELIEIEADDASRPTPNVRIGNHEFRPVGFCCHAAPDGSHLPWCRTRDTTRFPIAGPVRPLITDPNSRWAHINQGDRRG